MTKISTLRVAAMLAIVLFLVWAAWMCDNISYQKTQRAESEAKAISDTVQKYKTLAKHYELKAKSAERKSRVSDSLYHVLPTAAQLDSFRTVFRSRVRKGPVR